MRLVNNSAPPRETAVVAQVSFSDSVGFGALSQSESRGAPVFAPRGISYAPCEGDRLLMLPVNGAEVCVGCLSAAGDLKSGELRLTSAGGASILLKNDGEIALNGLIITRNGQIIPPGGDGD